MAEESLSTIIDNAPVKLESCSAAITRVEPYTYEGGNNSAVTGGARVFFSCEPCFLDTHVSEAFPDLESSVVRITERIEKTRELSCNRQICPNREIDGPIISKDLVRNKISQRKPWQKRYIFDIEPPY